MCYIILNLLVGVLYHLNLIVDLFPKFVYLRLCYFFPNNTFELAFFLDLCVD